MGVRTSEVGYTIATTRRETTKVHKNMWGIGEKNTDKRAVDDKNTVTNNVTEDVSSSALLERKSCLS